MSKTRWELVDFNSMEPEVSRNLSPTKWELAEPKEEEGLFSSLVKAPLRILEDTTKSAYEFGKKIPSYVEQGKTEVPGYFKTYMENPRSLLMQQLAGAQEGVNKLAQMPLDISRYGEERLNLVPHAVTSALEKITPEDTTEAINQLFPQPQYPGERLGRGFFRDIPEIAGASALGSALKSTTNKAMIKKILESHDLLENTGIHKFKQVSKGVNDRGINQIPMNPTQNPLSNVADYFDKTKQSQKLISDAMTGDYNALRKLQSDLYTNAKKNLKSPVETDRMRGAEIMEKRNDINKLISDHLVNTGNLDLNDLLNSARGDWSTLQKNYYNPKINRSIINMVDKETRKIPKNISKILSEDSKAMKKFKEFHKGLGAQLKGRNFINAIGSPLLKYGIPAGLGIAGYEAYKNLNGK